MEMTPPPHDLKTPYKDVQTAEPNTPSSPRDESPIPRPESLAPSSSPVSAIESTFSPRPGTPTRRLSSSSSISSTSFHSCDTSEAHLSQPLHPHPTSSPDLTKAPNPKSITIKNSCLQCAALGLRCTIAREPLRPGQLRSTNYCLRCAIAGEDFCILQDGITREFWAHGASEREVGIRVEELLAPKRELWRWCLPRIPPGARAGLRHVFWKDTADEVEVRCVEKMMECVCEVEAEAEDGGGNMDVRELDVGHPGK